MLRSLFDVVRELLRMRGADAEEARIRKLLAKQRERYEGE